MIRIKEHKREKWHSIQLRQALQKNKVRDVEEQVDYVIKIWSCTLSHITDFKVFIIPLVLIMLILTGVLKIAKWIVLFTKFVIFSGWNGLI